MAARRAPGVLRISEWERSDEASTLNNAYEYGYNGQHQQDVNEAAEGIGTYHSEQPENQEDGSYGPKHLDTPFRCLYEIGS